MKHDTVTDAELLAALECDPFHMAMAEAREQELDVLSVVMALEDAWAETFEMVARHPRSRDEGGADGLH